jgi:methyltransferase (TIGR00027 family)
MRHVCDTARWVALYRARESERPDALFHDPYARRMAGSKGEAMMRAMSCGPSIAWSMVVRTAVIDELIQRCITGGIRTIVNLGAGLDTRAFRMAFPDGIHWIDVDLPEMVDYRQECLKEMSPQCHHRTLQVDLADERARRNILEDVRDSGGPAMVVSEGVLAYLRPPQVSSLARELHGEPLVRWWLTDLITPMLMTTVGAFWGMQMAAAGTPLQFTPARSDEFFAPLGWREIEFRSIWTESLRLNRAASGTEAWNCLSKLWPPWAQESMRRMSGIALFENTVA